MTDANQQRLVFLAKQDPSEAPEEGFPLRRENSNRERQQLA